MKWKNQGKTITLAGRLVRPNEVFEALESEIPAAFRDLIRPVSELPPEPPAREFKHRRYAPGTHYPYDATFKSRFEASAILNEASRSYMNAAVWQMATANGLKGLIKELEGQGERAEDLLTKIEENFERIQVTRRREGKAELAELPAELLKLKLEGEGRLDITREELTYLGGILAKIEAREKQEDASRLLAHGPMGAASLRDGVVSEIDGQAVKVNRKGELIINCPQSPYNKMDLVSYRLHIVGPFVTAMKQPLSDEEKALGPANRPPRWSGDWADLPTRPRGVRHGD